MPRKFDHIREDILNLAKTNDIVSFALNVYSIAGIKDPPLIWERALILAVLELAKCNSRLEAENIKLLENGGTQIIVDFGALDEEAKQVILASIRKAKGGDK